MKMGPIRIDPKRALNMQLDARRFSRAVERFVRKSGPAAADRIVRKTAFDVAREIVVSLNGVTGLPKRIDTGRYRAAWAVAVEAVAGRRAGPQSTAAHAGDGGSTIEGTPFRRIVTVTNNVEYGPYIEYGTERMAAGMHRAAALAKVGKGIARLVSPEFAAAWRS